MLSVAARRSLLMLWDGLAWFLALTLFALIRYDWALNPEQWGMATLYTAAAVALQLLAGVLTQFYLGRHRVGSFAEATALGLIVVVVAVVLAVVTRFVGAFPHGVALVLPPLALLLMAAGRWAYRAWSVTGKRAHGGGADDATPVVVYGAGDAGHAVARLVQTAAEPPYRITGFVDDDRGYRYRRVRGHRVLGTGDDIIEVVNKTGADAVILAISAPPPDLVARLSDQCGRAGVRLLIVPPVREMVGGRVSLGALRELNVTDLLGRRPVKTDVSSIAHYIADKRVLITGAGGSIGSELARQVHQLGPAKLILLDRDESVLHDVQLSLYGNGLLETDDMVLCDIRDQVALRQVFERHHPEVVFHAAALKHLPMLERFPAEGWKTNVLGTLNVLKCAQEGAVRHFVNISTDKAADATSVLGQTKRIAERLTAWYAAHYGLPYLSVRFGNVLGSRGSVLHAFRTQIERGGPVTVTDPEVTRFFMTIPEACELVLQAGAMGQQGDVLVLDMGDPVRIVDVARRLIDESGRSVEIVYTGLRHGEKLHEVLFSGHERGVPSTHPLINQVSVPGIEPERVAIDPDDLLAMKLLLGQQAASGDTVPADKKNPSAPATGVHRV